MPAALILALPARRRPFLRRPAGVPFVYVAVDRAAPQGEAILVAKDSPIRAVADLKGKRVASIAAPTCTTY